MLERSGFSIGQGVDPAGSTEPKVGVPGLKDNSTISLILFFRRHT